MEVNDEDVLGNHCQEFGRELASLGDVLNERGEVERQDYEEMMRLSCFASVGLATVLALFVAFQLIRRRYVRNQWRSWPVNSVAIANATINSIL